jgi:hypothetical protein
MARTGAEREGAVHYWHAKQGITEHLDGEDTVYYGCVLRYQVDAAVGRQAETFDHEREALTTMLETLRVAGREQGFRVVDDGVLEV